ncbi:porin [Paraburkholderia sediminicola]|uniref:porin n=1 Tax=Paraburkholderia sediminicola TaxID=458836 RepID=UPI0038B95DAC
MNYWLANEENSVELGGIIYTPNAVSYRLFKGDFKVEALYAFGNMPGEISVDQTIAAGAAYDNGRLAVTAGYLEKNNANGQRDLRTYTTSVGYHTGPIFLRMGYTDFDQPLGNNIYLTPPLQMWRFLTQV